ncbi:unnamed protein product [Ceutorhynchus assimilis]|uniref:Uncharacterized protein n=1 Tax=Ceutorhynchus assimilis TaxID=467358 RepID=A0A9N9MQ91_9CUCU|nr:unnamed protein product [Ceutorhynchus assimilis]
MFAIKTTDAFWCGTWSDMVIEQHSMIAIKTQGGLTQRRGFIETTLARWIASMAPCSSVTNMLENFSSEHVELRHSRQQRDENDLSKFSDWLETYNPFESRKFISLYSQAVAHDTVNCDKVQSINNTIIVNKREVVINPMQLFKRIICSNKSPEQLKECFSYELAPYPLSLFKDGHLRGGSKSQLLKEFDSILPPGQHTPNCPNNTVYVLDGGLVLHKAVWQKPATYREICIQYVNYAVHSYGRNCVVIFDGYDETHFSTKGQLQKLRSNQSLVVDLINLDTAVSCTQEEFLKNNEKKKSLLCQKVFPKKQE